jgi:hypothetical protein
MVSGVALIFGVPVIIAAVLISPSVHGVLFYAVLGLLLPVAGWRIFLTRFAFPPSGTGRVAAVLNLWLGGIVMVAAVINLAIAVLDYSPVRPGPNPTAGFLLAGFFPLHVRFLRCLGRIRTDPSARGCYSRSADDRSFALRCLRDARFSGLQVKSRGRHTISTATGSQKPLREP